MTTNQPPVEPPEWTLARIEASAALASWRCRHCDAEREPLAPSAGGLPRAVGLTHQEGCPDYVEP